jgi:hypothetical protein
MQKQVLILVPGLAKEANPVFMMLVSNSDDSSAVVGFRMAGKIKWCKPFKRFVSMINVVQLV